jgi:hypothetical protein
MIPAIPPDRINLLSKDQLYCPINKIVLVQSQPIGKLLIDAEKMFHFIIHSLFFKPWIYRQRNQERAVFVYKIQHPRDGYRGGESLPEEVVGPAEIGTWPGFRGP